eukprot:s3831_g3.t1
MGGWMDGMYRMAKHGKCRRPDFYQRRGTSDEPHSSEAPACRAGAASPTERLRSQPLEHSPTFGPASADEGGRRASHERPWMFRGR